MVNQCYVNRELQYRMALEFKVYWDNSRIKRGFIINITPALDGHTTFYMKKYPGRIKIKLDKDENSYEAYHRIKAICEGIKKVINQAR